MSPCIDFIPYKISKTNIKQMVVHWTTGGIDIEEVNSFQLLVSASTESGFEFLSQTIGISFAFKCPSRIYDIRVIFLFDYSPCSK
jgi:hypothetical protein